MEPIFFLSLLNRIEKFPEKQTLRLFNNTDDVNRL